MPVHLLPTEPAWVTKDGRRKTTFMTPPETRWYPKSEAGKFYYAEAPQLYSYAFFTAYTRRRSMQLSAFAKS
jgi:hypothetical protein